MSAPHIYHSALLLSPKTSIVQELYGPQVNPLARVIHGAPTSWGQSIATKTSTAGFHIAVWSPCSKHIAITQGDKEIAVLDAVTLEQLHTLHIEQRSSWRELIFSPDGYLLTAHLQDAQSYHQPQIYQTVSWDLQTGGLVGDIRGNKHFDSMTFSGCGAMLGGLFGLSGRQGIVIYDIVSGTQISSHSLPGPDIIRIWTHGECLQFATIELGFIIIWEVGFTSTNVPIQVTSLHVPSTFNSSDKVAFLPTLFQLSFIHQGKIIVWDALHQKILLDSVIVDPSDLKGPSDFEDPNDAKDYSDVSFSTGGHFLTCRIGVQKHHLWKQSPDGYLPHQHSLSSPAEVTVVISPDGESIISYSGSQLQLLQTNSHTYSSSILPEHPWRFRFFLFEFSPDRLLVAFVRQLGNVVTILDVKSGNPHLVINTGMEVCGIRITESSVIAVSLEEAITWELPAGDHVLNVPLNIDDGIQIATFGLSDVPTPLASISPDLNYVVLAEPDVDAISIFSMDTGEQLVVTEAGGWLPGFTLDGTGVWCATSISGSKKIIVIQWAIIRDDESNIIELEHTGEAMNPQSGFPWHSSCGYQITDDGWVRSSGGKLLLWLPHHWQSVVLEKKWSGNFLALSQQGAPEAIILELEM